MPMRIVSYQHDMNQFDVRIAFSSGLVRSYLDFLLSFDYPLRVLVPFKVIAKARRTSGILIPSKHEKC